MVKIEDLTLFRGKSRIFNHLNLQIPKGPIVALTGSSGSGKTSLILALLKLIPIQGGKIFLDGKDTQHMSSQDISKTAGIVFQDFALFPHLNVLENILLAPRLQKLNLDPLPLLTRLRINPLSNRYPHELSGGQKQRVSIARSLILQPKILLMDEPSSALDPDTTNELSDLLTELNSETQIICISHDLSFIKRCCQRILKLEDGKFTTEL